jgi:hypothetical protein
VRLPEPFCEFCRHEGKFDYSEWHAIVCGVGDGLQPWLPQDEAHKDNRHYYTLFRGLATLILLLGVVRELRR